MIFTCTNFTGFILDYGTSAVVTASTAREASDILEKKLAEMGLAQRIHPDNMILVQETEEPNAEILFDGQV